MSKPINPHVLDIHVPAHVLGIGAVLLAAVNWSWWIVPAFLLFNLWFSGLGMSVGFHRYFTHRAFHTTRWWRRVMLWGGTLAGQGSVIFWTALHRAHHPASDQPHDIHTPRKGFWNAYMGWIFSLDPNHVSMARAVDLIRDPECKWTHRHYKHILWTWWIVLLILTLTPLQPMALGAMIAGLWSIHQEALINSVCHDPRFGDRNHVTSDDSRDVRWLNWLTWGQSLHNTHHKFPQRSDFGWTVRDLGYYLVRLIQTPEKAST